MYTKVSWYTDTLISYCICVLLGIKALRMLLSGASSVHLLEYVHHFLESSRARETPGGDLHARGHPAPTALISLHLFLPHITAVL